MNLKFRIRRRGHGPMSGDHSLLDQEICLTKDEEDQAIYAIALLTRSELTALGPAFDRAWPIDRTPCFAGLLQSIDDTENKRLAEKVEDEPHSLETGR